MEKQFVVNLSDELLAELGWPEAEVSDRVREALVMDLLRFDRISEAQAAELLELDRWALIDVMGRHEVPAIKLTPDDLEKELSESIQRDF